MRMIFIWRCMVKDIMTFFRKGKTMTISTQRFMRQADICPPEKLQFPIHVIGAGAIGSAAVLTLAKMGCGNITVQDHDILEEHNLPNQIVKPSCLGRPKVEALKELVLELTEVEIGAIAEKYKNQLLKGVIIAAVDNMRTRKIIWKNVKLNPQIGFLIDPRMGAEFARIYIIRPCDMDDISFYEENLYAQKESEHLPCSARSIIYCPGAIGSIIAFVIKNYAVNEAHPKEILLNLPSLLLSFSA